MKLSKVLRVKNNMEKVLLGVALFLVVFFLFIYFFHMKFLLSLVGLECANIRWVFYIIKISMWAILVPGLLVGYDCSRLLIGDKIERGLKGLLM